MIDEVLSYGTHEYNGAPGTLWSWERSNHAMSEPAISNLRYPKVSIEKHTVGPMHEQHSLIGSTSCGEDFTRDSQSVTCMAGEISFH